ncbi:MAG TPA: hypothetical protein VMB49_13710 [Acidobacteriaceae bacterium]|nr:hypothetical protein [Acidobacteriaceae bacterium]
MINHLIWAAGLLAHLLLVIVLLVRRRATRFPWFTLLIVFYLLRSVALAATVRFSGHPVHQFANTIVDLTDVLLQCAVLTELTLIALRPLGAIRRFTLPLLLLASGILIVMRLAPHHHLSLRSSLAISHFLLAVLMVEWGIVLAFLIGPLRLSFRSHVAVISFGFAIYSAGLLAGGGYFTTGREMSDYVFFSFFRVCIYLVIVIFWSIMLWLAEPAGQTQSPAQQVGRK